MCIRDRDVPVLMTNFPTILNRLTGMFSEDRADFIASFNAVSYTHLQFSGGKPMKTINLRWMYPHYRHDEFVDVTDEVWAAMYQAQREKMCIRDRKNRAKAA